MAKLNKSKCKTCRRAGQKLFLRGEKCFGPKCPMIKRAYPPGPKRKRRMRGGSEYGKELQEKQKLKFWYGLKERQFKKYVREFLNKRNRGAKEEMEDISTLLIKKLESRLDNIVFRLGFATSRDQARQLVSHGHFLVNNKKVDFPSYEAKKGNMISVNPKSLKKNVFQNLVPILKKYQPQAWLELNKDKFEGKILREPTLAEINPPADILMILEFYSK